MSTKKEIVEPMELGDCDNFPFDANANYIQPVEPVEPMECDSPLDLTTTTTAKAEAKTEVVATTKKPVEQPHCSHSETAVGKYSEKSIQIMDWAARGGHTTIFSGSNVVHQSGAQEEAKKSPIRARGRPFNRNHLRNVRLAMFMGGTKKF